MEQFLIIVAIMAACLLLSRAVAPPRRPDFTVRDRLPTDGIVYSCAALGKTCRSTERGNGVDLRRLGDLKRMLSDLTKNKKGRELEAWETTLVQNERYVACAAEQAKRAMRFCYMLGHVRSFPRVFLLCNKIVRSSFCDVSVKTFVDAVQAFASNAALTYSEIAILPNMLRFCLLGAVAEITEKAHSDIDIFLKGAADGAEGKIDLDSLAFCDYVCGLYYSADAATAAVYDSVLTGNGISRAECEKTRGLKLAKANATVDAAVRSLHAADSLSAERLIEFSAAHKRLSTDDSYLSLSAEEKFACLAKIEKSSRKCKCSEAEEASRVLEEAEKSGADAVDVMLKSAQSDDARLFLICMPIFLFVVAFVLVCIFSPPRYAAIFPVVAVIIYACFRLYAPIEAVRILSKPFDKAIAFVTKKIDDRRAATQCEIRNDRSVDVIRLGSGAEYERNTLRGAISVTTNGYGAVAAACENAAYLLGASVETDDGIIDLPVCDSAFLPYKSIYRYVSDGTEFCAEVLSAADTKCCCIRLTVVNRTCEIKRVKLSSVCKPLSERNECNERSFIVTAPITGGAALCGRAGSVGLGMGADAEYFGVERADDHASFGLPVFGKCFFPMLSARKSVEIAAFSRFVEVACVAFAVEQRPLERMLALARSDGYFDFAESAARAYSELYDGHGSDDGVIVDKMLRHVAMSGERRIDENERNNMTAAKFDYALKLGVGGFLKDGGYAVECSDAAPPREWKNCLSDGDICSEITHSGGGFCYDRAFPDGLTADSCCADILPSAFVIIGERGEIWSPTARPLGKGNLAAVHRFGYSEYLCEYNGTVCSLKRYLARGRRAEIFDIDIENKADLERRLDVMFAVTAADVWSAVHADRDSVTVTDRNGGGFIILASERVRETAEYRECYFAHGKVDRTSSFGKAGRIIAPALSVRISIAPHKKRRAIFCIAAIGDNGIENIDEADADMYFSQNVEAFSKLGRIKLLSSDTLLDCLHAWSLYQSYTYGFLREKSVRHTVSRTALISCLAVKYIDIAAVKDVLMSACAKQYSDGSIEFDDGSSPYDCLILPHVIKDFIEYTDDYSILEETAQFRSRKRSNRVVRRATVIEHCMRAVERSIALYCVDPDNKLRGIYIALLRFYADCCADTRRRTALISEYGKRVVERKQLGVAVTSDVLEAADGTRIYGIGSVDTLLRVFDRYEADERDAAFAELKRLVDRGDTPELAFRYGAEPYFICEYVLRGDLFGVACGEDPAAAALFYVAVTEKLMGVKIRGARARLDPKPPSGSIETEYYIAADKGSIMITVDTSETVGEWQINADRITFATDSIDISEKCERRVVLRRSGKKK